MGYSCTQDASYMLGVIGHAYATDGNPNVLTINKRRYFFERGKEQADGAITGKLMREFDDMCMIAGSVRIEPDGTITKFPQLDKSRRAELFNTLRDMSARNEPLLRLWAAGRI